MFNQAKALRMRLNGSTYAEIGRSLKVSRQRVQQRLSPPVEIRDFVVTKFKGLCVVCDLKVGKSGHVHHKKSNGATENHYNDINNLLLLCLSCHRRVHPMPLPSKENPVEYPANMIRMIHWLITEKDLTIYRIAMTLRITPATVYNYLSGKSKPHPRTQRHILKMFKENGGK